VDVFRGGLQLEVLGDPGKDWTLRSTLNTYFSCDQDG
jgi:hypothetical protein